MEGLPYLWTVLHIRMFIKYNDLHKRVPLRVAVAGYSLIKVYAFIMFSC
jgi:hypothetical protein